MTDVQAPDNAMYAIVEVLGRRRFIGRVTETTLAGGGFLLVETLNKDGSVRGTRYVPPGSIYCIEPCSREQVLLYAPDPIGELSAPFAELVLEHDDGDDDYEED